MDVNEPNKIIPFHLRKGKEGRPPPLTKEERDARLKKNKKRKNLRKKGKKKKKKVRHVEYYRLIITARRKLFTYVMHTYIKEKALKAFDLIISENRKNVRFPVKISSVDHKLVHANYELLLLKRNVNDEGVNPMLRNEYGKQVEHTTNSDKLAIFKKETYHIEETFWVWGYNNRVDRKDFHFILNELILKDTPNCRYPIKRILVYKNKLIIENEEDFDMVICKTESDCVRLYNELEKDIKKLKFKSVFFSGMASGSYQLMLEEKIIKKTGWDINKIRRFSTKYGFNL